MYLQRCGELSVSLLSFSEESIAVSLCTGFPVEFREKRAKVGLSGDGGLFFLFRHDVADICLYLPDY